MPDTLTTALTKYYDAVPYDSHPFPQTAAEHLEALAHLFGLETTPPSSARVLELGCAAGGNLLPFAARHPGGRAIGVDLSPVQVAQGAAAIAQAGLDNIELRTYDITDIDASFGQFDYVVCHGVYSWVPPTVQSAILRVCSENLAPHGIAYVSYNVYPGWKAREIVRDAMILRGGPRDAPDEKLSFARGMLEFLEQSAKPDSVLKKTLEETMPIVRGSNSSYLLHEFLEPCNAPCYFKEFVERAGTHGLAYLADAEPSTMFVQNYGEKVREPLLRECGNSQVMIEQYLDFLVNRTFRQTLLVKKERVGDVRYRLDPARLRAMGFAGVFLPDDGGQITLDGPEQPCTALRNLKVTLRLPVHKAVAQVLDRRYPAAIWPEALFGEVSALTGEPREAVEPFVMAMLEELLILGAVRLRRSPFEAAARVSDMPRALPAVRNLPGLALQHGPNASACNLWHEHVQLSQLERCLLPLIDGAHGPDAMAEHLLAEARAERIRFMKDGQPMTDESVLREFAVQQVALALKDLRRKGLLAA
jgi:SAM-dependent methyltransferase